MTHQFWLGLSIGPFVGYFALMFIAWCYRKWARFYRGTAAFSWIGLGLIILGMKLVKPRDMKTAMLNKRHYFSPNTKAFEVQDTP